jgi:FKBP-type peptidyl-prolyl cis-trans isomerase SlyD
MKIASGHVVAIDYRLHLGDGKVVDASEPGDPLSYLHGTGQIVPGLEKALEGLVVGDARQVVVSPEDGYGPSDPEAVQEVPRTAFPAELKPEIGMELVAQGPAGEPVPFVVKDVKLETVVVDMNHPLAGKTLHFDVTVKDIRAATADELEHGHAHGPDGHHH